MITCPLCPGARFETVRMLLKHVRMTHSDHESFSIQCSLQGCKRTFRTLSTYLGHVYSHHDCGVLDAHEPDDAPGGSGQGSNVFDGAEGGFDDVTIADGTTGGEIVQPFEMVMQRAAATWILKIREGHRIPLSVVDTIISDLQSLLHVAHSQLLEAVELPLREAGVSSEVAERIWGELRRANPASIFRGLQTQSQQLQYFRTHFRLVEPRKIVLGSKQKRVGCGSKRRLVEQDDCMVYVPILESLESLLQSDSVLAEIERGHQSTEPGVMKDFCDGLQFRSHHLFSVCTNALQLLFYYDDVEVCNPLGSSRTKHKVGMFYFLLGNLRPQYRSKLRAIQLVAICRSRFIKKYTLNKVLEPIVEDLKKLERGYEVAVGSAPYNVRGTVAVVSADNLASNALGGFKESASAVRHCRQCLGCADETATKFEEEHFVLRSRSQHLQHCALLEDEEDDYIKNSRDVGVNHRSILLDLQYFDMCSGALLPDVMHDVLEGALQYEVKLLLQYCIREKRYFSVSDLNEAIEGMELGYMETDRPAPITSKTIYARDSNSLKQKATQMWTLARLLPLMVGDHVPIGDDHWENFLLMLQVTDYLMAPEITQDEVAYLQVLIRDHHTGFTEIYPEASVIPKMHYIVHMPRLIMKFGPLVRHWTMRYEARHSYFKKMAQNIGNYINISWTLAMRHQLLQCYYSLDQEALFEDSPEVGPGDVVAIRDRPDELVTATECYRAKWVKIAGVTYKKPSALLVGVEEDYPQLGLLQGIYVVNNNRVLFRVRLCVTEGFDSHHHVFIISSTSTYKLVEIGELYNPHPVHVRTVTSSSIVKQAVVMKYHIHDTLQT